MRTTWLALETYLQRFMARLAERPRAILLVSAHWEAPRPTLNNGVAPSLLFDYVGFPDHTYRLTWPAPGSPDIARRVRDLLGIAGIVSDEDNTRGWDHGVFVPMKVILPAADIPVVQLSLQYGLDPSLHLAMGRALKPLRGEGVLIIGSGQTYHNMRGSTAGSMQSDLMAEAFDAWLREQLVDSRTRDLALTNWELAPYARHAQPHEDHLLPLMVAAGAASGEPGYTDFHGHALGKPISGFRFGALS